MSPLARSSPAARQRGAATLVVVMVLFFVMAMMAAFANRNLVFEQRIASNYYRTGLAQEAAEAGAEWAISMLNGVNVDGSCQAVSGASQSFRQRYLSIDASSRALTQVSNFQGADCRINADGSWTCQCAAGTWAAQAAASASTQVLPSFQITFSPQTSRPGVLRITSTGCTSRDVTDCNDTNKALASLNALGSARLMVDLALVSALKMPPATPLTGLGTVTASSNDLGLHNADPRSSGLLMWVGGAANDLAQMRLDSLPGTPGSQAVISSDGTGLGAKTPDDMFKMFFGMSASSYASQPAVREIACSGDCAPALLAAYNSGVRLAWVNGPLTLASNVVLGSATSPMVIIANGAVTLNGPMLLTGIVYARGNLDWIGSAGQPARLTGALLSEGNVTISGPVDLWYQAAVMDVLSNQSGSFVRVPGGWWDGS